MKKTKIKFKDIVKMFNELSKIKPKRFTTVKNLLKPWNFRYIK